MKQSLKDLYRLYRTPAPDNVLPMNIQSHETALWLQFLPFMIKRINQ